MAEMAISHQLSAEPERRQRSRSTAAGGPSGSARSGYGVLHLVHLKDDQIADSIVKVNRRAPRPPWARRAAS